MQPHLIVSIQGFQASFHEIAAKAYYQQSIELRYKSSFSGVFEDLTTGESDKIFVAVSNSTHGTIKEVQKLIHIHGLSCEGVYSLPIRQHVLGIPGTKIYDVTRILSHPVALSQCKKFFKYNPGIEQLEYFDTAAAAKLVREMNDSSTAAIGSAAAAELYGLEIIKEAIQDDPRNTTIFQSFSLAK